jgi:hypothetical protein
LPLINKIRIIKKRSILPQSMDEVNDVSQKWLNTETQTFLPL